MKKWKNKKEGCSQDGLKIDRIASIFRSIMSKEPRSKNNTMSSCRMSTITLKSKKYKSYHIGPSRRY